MIDLASTALSRTVRRSLYQPVTDLVGKRWAITNYQLAMHCAAISPVFVLALAVSEWTTSPSGVLLAIWGMTVMMWFVLAFQLYHEAQALELAWRRARPRRTMPFFDLLIISWLVLLNSYVVLFFVELSVRHLFAVGYVLAYMSARWFLDCVPMRPKPKRAPSINAVPQMSA